MCVCVCAWVCALISSIAPCIVETRQIPLEKNSTFKCISSCYCLIYLQTNSSLGCNTLIYSMGINSFSRSYFRSQVFSQMIFNCGVKMKRKRCYYSNSFFARVNQLEKKAHSGKVKYFNKVQRETLSFSLITTCVNIIFKFKLIKLIS